MILKNIKNEFIDLTQEPEMVDHISDNRNFGNFIINEINSGYYNKFLDGSEKVVIDAGANVGLFSLFLSAGVDKIYMIEPTPRFCNILRSIKDKLLPNAEIIECALSNEDGIANFVFCDFNTTSNSLVGRYGVQTQVPTIGINTLLSRIETDIDLFKIDIEGAEEMVIDALTQENANKIKKIILETHKEAGVNHQNVVDKLKSLGFKTEEAGYLVYATR